MSNLLSVIQSIAVKSVQATNPASLAYGKVTKVEPLEIQITESLLTISGSTIILTESVVEKKLTIQKHTHKVGGALEGHAHGYYDWPGGVQNPTYTLTTIPAKSTDVATGPIQSAIKDAEVVDTVLEAVCTEYGEDLPTDSDDDRIVITLNRALEEGDGVVMLRLEGGQQFMVLSRIFKHAEEGE